MRTKFFRKRYESTYSKRKQSVCSVHIPSIKVFECSHSSWQDRRVRQCKKAQHSSPVSNERVGMKDDEISGLSFATAWNIVYSNLIDAAGAWDNPKSVKPPEPWLVREHEGGRDCRLPYTD